MTDVTCDSTGFYPRAGEFLMFLIAAILVALCSAGIGLFCSSFSNNILVGLALSKQQQEG